MTSEREQYEAEMEAGRASSRAKGLAEGRAEGRAEGLVKGERKANIKAIKMMLGVLPKERILQEYTEKEYEEALKEYREGK